MGEHTDDSVPPPDSVFPELQYHLYHCVIVQLLRKISFWHLVNQRQTMYFFIFGFLFDLNKISNGMLLPNRDDRKSFERPLQFQICYQTGLIICPNSHFGNPYAVNKSWLTLR